MKHKILLPQAILPAILLAFSVQANEPSGHVHGDKEPDCCKMEEMDHSKMDMDDPAMQTMMEKCKHEMHRGESESDDSVHKHHKHHKSHGNDDEDRSSKHEH